MKSGYSPETVVAVNKTTHTWRHKEKDYNLNFHLLKKSEKSCSVPVYGFRFDRMNFGVEVF
jgi:hypothetical protein